MGVVIVAWSLKVNVPSDYRVPPEMVWVVRRYEKKEVGRRTLGKPSEDLLIDLFEPILVKECEARDGGIIQRRQVLPKQAVKLSGFGNEIQALRNPYFGTEVLLQ